MMPSRHSLQSTRGTGWPGAPWGQEDGGRPLLPPTPWLTSGSRFSGGSVKGTLHTGPFFCVGVSGLQGGGRWAGVMQGAAMGMVLPGPCLGRQRPAFISLNMIPSVTRNHLKHACCTESKHRQGGTVMSGCRAPLGFEQGCIYRK